MFSFFYNKNSKNMKPNNVTIKTVRAYNQVIKLKINETIQLENTDVLITLRGVSRTFPAVGSEITKADFYIASEKLRADKEVTLALFKNKDMNDGKVAISDQYMIGDGYGIKLMSADPSAQAADIMLIFNVF